MSVVKLKTASFDATLIADGKTAIAVIAALVGGILQYGPSLSVVFQNTPLQHDIGYVISVAGWVAALLSAFGIKVTAAQASPGSAPPSPAPPPYSPPEP